MAGKMGPGLRLFWISLGDHVWQPPASLLWTLAVYKISAPPIAWDQPCICSSTQAKMATPDIETLDISDSDPEDLFASPSRATKPKSKHSSKPSESSNAPPQQRNAGESKYDAEQARDAALQRELESVRNINELIEGVVSSLDTAKGNMDVRYPTDN